MYLKNKPTIRRKWKLLKPLKRRLVYIFHFPQHESLQVNRTALSLADRIAVPVSFPDTTFSHYFYQTSACSNHPLYNRQSSSKLRPTNSAFYSGFLEAGTTLVRLWYGVDRALIEGKVKDVSSRFSYTFLSDSPDRTIHVPPCALLLSPVMKKDTFTAKRSPHQAKSVHSDKCAKEENAQLRMLSHFIRSTSGNQPIILNIMRTKFA